MTTEATTTSISATSETKSRVPITVTYGDGIGPEIMRAVLFILEKGGARIDVEVVEVGEKVYLLGNTSGIPQEAWESIYRTRVLLKAPITTPQGAGYKSLNVTMRKTLGLFANVRPCVNYAPFVPSKHPQMDIVIIRENEEDLYAGIEHRQTDEVVQCLKLVSRPGTEKIIRYAFEYARAHGRRKVTCMTKDNIMKMTDGLFHRLFREIGQAYPDIEREHYIIDIGSARLADTPERFDVIVTLNLYGDIISDIAAQVSGSVGLAGSANVGSEFAMFEAIHGSAPDIAGKGIANPSGLLMGAMQMLAHIGQGDVAEVIHNAWLRTIEDGFHTPDIYNESYSKISVGTQGFAQAVVDRLGERPRYLRPVTYAKTNRRIHVHLTPTAPTNKQLVGVDVFLHWTDRNAEALGERLKKHTQGQLSLQMITNRGVKVWPQGHPATFCTDHWRCRFQTPSYTPISYQEVLLLLNQLYTAGFEIIKTENLYTFDGEPGFSLGQGQ
ncbi:MAG: NADP-dependent isocitrate dehydrogenase [Saprospiraceae bacterium]|nr:NADP-dependent isocitrate dehydrogenase [Saprospiraceae bacterium]MDW8483628.1 NADP-dependent isocitrate dehydrogenase [Saprospiraceae bacterium]